MILNAKYQIENSNVHKKMSTNYFVFQMFDGKSFMIKFNEMNMNNNLCQLRSQIDSIKKNTMIPFDDVPASSSIHLRPENNQNCSIFSS